MAQFLAQHWLLNRRHVLRGLGVSLALPLLNCMQPLRAAETAKRAKRSVFIYLPNGVNTLDFQITQAGADYQFSKSRKPLEKHKAHITPISGLYHPRGLGHHYNCSSIWLTGAKIGQSERNVDIRLQIHGRCRPAKLTLLPQASNSLRAWFGRVDK